MEMETESTEQTGLAYLPDVVYTEGLLPLLSVNEVLRLRRVCKPLKSICDDHLRKKCPSKSLVQLRDSEKEPKEIHTDWLSNFLEFDSTSSIRIPSSHFCLEYRESIGQLSLDLSTRYGAQIKHLSMERMELPFVSNSSQFNFFQNLPNLTSLTLENIYIVGPNNVNAADQGIAPESLPTCFKNSIRKFEVSKVLLEWVSDANKFWDTVGLFEKLECFQFPGVLIKKGSLSAAPLLSQNFDNCCKLIGSDSSNIKCFDLLNLDDTFEPSEESLASFSEVSLRNKIKWKNVPAWIIDEPLYVRTWRPNADLIVSISHFGSQDANEEGLSFPNLISLKVNNVCFGLPFQEALNGRLGPDWSHISQILSPAIFPALRILKVTMMTTGDNIYFSEAWQYLTNLEEVSFELSGNKGDIYITMRLSSETFLGDRTQEPPFLHLTKLKKLSIHIPNDQRNPFSIQEAFHKAFRLMPLKEFKITSEFPIKSQVFDKDAILSLCAPGPFIENIEKFSFRNWCMKDVTDDEFRQLGRMFPNNQAL